MLFLHSCLIGKLLQSYCWLGWVLNSKLLEIIGVCRFTNRTSFQLLKQQN